MPIARLQRTILLHRMLDGGIERLGVAVSGGADSVCLLLMLRELGLARLSILHLNHLLRGEESEADEAFVRALGQRFDLPVHVRRADPKSAGGNLEEEARRLRYEFYREYIGSGAVECVATGHTLSDQAETVLFRLLRGAHLAGLSAIHPVAPGPVIRPLIDISRQEVEEFLRRAGEPWREDRSNRDLSFDRNRIRHVLMPELEREWNPEIERTLGRLAALAFDEEGFWSAEIAGRAEAHFKIQGNIVLANASKLVSEPVAVARRLVRRAIEQVRGDLHSIGFEHVEAILELARQVEGSGRLQVPQVDVYRSFDWIRFAPSPSGDQLERRNQQTRCEVPGTAELAAAGVLIELEIREVIENTECRGEPEAGREGARVKEYELDWDRVLACGTRNVSELWLRTWKPGDQYTPAESERAEPRKLKTMFQEARIPLWERGTWPILTIGSTIVWVREFGPAAEVAPGSGSRRVLLVREIGGCPSQ